MSITMLGFVAVGAAALIGAGLWIEARPGIDPLAGPKRFWAAVRRHPVPIFGIIETGAWLLVLVSLIEHLRQPESGIGWVIWALTIGPHEIGHVICMPFGWTLQFLGGSIWQVLIFILPAIFALVLRRQISGSLFFWALTGHSLINLSRYIDDASARELPLLFGMSKDHHDWWNLLGHYGLLDYDHTLAMMVKLAGIGIILLAVGLGIFTAWVLPRTRLGHTRRL